MQVLIEYNVYRSEKMEDSYRRLLIFEIIQVIRGISSQKWQ
jgi:hypothetical protein